MIEKISLKNFKCFERIDVTCRDLNLFTGINGMGKSTLIQALLLLRQTYEKNNCLENGLLLCFECAVVNNPRPKGHGLVTAQS